MEIKWLSLALKDLDEIFDFIAKDNKTAAKKILKLIWEETKILSKHPQIGKPGRVDGTRELYITKTNFIVPYRVKKNTIEILRVFHSARDWKNEL